MPGIEIDLLKNYPKTKRDINDRGDKKTSEDQEIARKFGIEFFDGSRSTGYGGFEYHPRFWKPVIPAFIEHWGLIAGMSVLDVGCAKGFMLHDIKEDVPGIRVAGIDISEYAIENSMQSVRPFLTACSAENLPFEDNSFDVVISINTVHNLERESCITALKEIQRVSRLGSFITVDAYRTEAEKNRMYNWNLTAKTILSVDDWLKLFDEAGYTGDYYWFIP